MKYDCIIVLANEMNKEGVLNLESLSRIQLACESFQKMSATYLITCGWDYRADSDIIIGEIMKSYAIDLGVSEEHILTDTQARDTVGNAFFTKLKFIEPHSLKNILVITSDYRVERTKQIFSFIYGANYNLHVIGAAGLNEPEKILGEKKSIAAFESTFHGIPPGDNKAIAAVLKSKHPFYNGQIYPIMETIEV